MRIKKAYSFGKNQKIVYENCRTLSDKSSGLRNFAHKMLLRTKNYGCFCPEIFQMQKPSYFMGHSAKVINFDKLQDE